jgi:hypothetical protein
MSFTRLKEKRPMRWELPRAVDRLNGMQLWLLATKPYLIRVSHLESLAAQGLASEKNLEIFEVDLFHLTFHLEFALL